MGLLAIYHWGGATWYQIPDVWGLWCTCPTSGLRKPSTPWSLQRRPLTNDSKTKECQGWSFFCLRKCIFCFFFLILWFTIIHSGFAMIYIYFYHDLGFTISLAIVGLVFSRKITVKACRFRYWPLSEPDHWDGFHGGVVPKDVRNSMEIACTLWLFNIAMGNGPFIDGLPIKNGGSFHGELLNNKMVYTSCNRHGGIFGPFPDIGKSWCHSEKNSLQHIPQMSGTFPRIPPTKNAASGKYLCSGGVLAGSGLSKVL